jgi:hypothetical protein
MSMRSFSMLVLVLAGSEIIAPAQNPPTQTADESRSTPAPALSGVMGIDSSAPEEDTSSALPQIPALLGGPGMSLAFSSEQDRSNYLRGGLNVGATYDDNALLVSTEAVGNTTFSVFPNIALEQTVPRMHWKLGYAAGLTVNQRLSNRNQGSHGLKFDSQFRLSPHVNLRVAEDFSLTTGFFDSGSGVVAGGNGGPNASLITPLSKQRSSSTVAEVNYHFALKDVVGASGSFYDLHFSDVPAGSTLTDTRTAAGSAFWLHGLFGRDWAGISYRFQRVTFDPSGETRVHSIMVVNTVNLPSRFTFTGFIGPEYSDNHGIPSGGGTGQALHFSDWSLAGGVEAGWQKEHTSVGAGYSRRISDGGGVLGVVRLQSLHGGVRQQLLPGWAVTVGASYGNNKSLTVLSAASASSINVTSITASVERNLGKSFGLGLAYAHDYQKQTGSGDPTPQDGIHRNRFSVTLGYQWARPLGR